MTNNIRWREVSCIGECAVCGRALHSVSSLPPHLDVLSNGLFVHHNDDMVVVCVPWQNRVVDGEIVGGGCLGTFLDTHPEWEAGS